MKRIVVLLLLAGHCMADRAAPPPVPERLAAADLAVLGKVVRIEDKPVELPTGPGAKSKGAFRVAVIEVKERMAGPVAKTIRLAYSPGGRRDPLLNLSAGDERLFFLTRQHGTDYYRAMGWDCVESPAAENLAAARRAGRLLSNPLGGLKSKDAGERALAAGLLIIRHRTRPLAEAKDVVEADVPAVESKLILEAVASADWKSPVYSQLSPRGLFLRLGLTEKNGWKVANLADLEADAKKWLEANAGKYKMKKLTTGVTAEP